MYVYIYTEYVVEFPYNKNILKPQISQLAHGLTTGSTCFAGGPTRALAEGWTTLEKPRIFIPVMDM